MKVSPAYDIAIVGGGLAGLALSIQCVRAGLSTVLFEKEKYPFHRVCGEYVSLESWNFLQELGVPLSDMHLPIIQRTLISSPSGKYIEHPLPLGGFGISRYSLDHQLALIAKREGVHLLEQTRVTDIRYNNNQSTLIFTDGELNARVVAGTFGKRSNIDIRWKRSFVVRKPNSLNHFIAVKYHIKTLFPSDLIALHNFQNGYCGISRIENNLCCLCYLTTAGNLRKSRGEISVMEDTILRKNPFIDKIFANSEFVYEEPLTISQISFNRKTQVENHVLMIGDAAGMITPLCGNGMSMALHGSKLAFEEIMLFFKQGSSRFEMEQQYSQRWEKQFGSRLQAGRIIQRFFGGQSQFLISAVRPFPSFISFLIRQTHGEPY